MKKNLIIIDNKIFIDFVNFFGGIRKIRIEKIFFLVFIVIICLKLF